MALENRYSLKTNPFQFSVFTPAQVTPVTYDEKALPESLEKAYNWEQKDYQVRSGYREMGDKIRNELNPAEYKWWDELYSNSMNRIKQESNVGNYETAIRFAQQEADRLFDDTDVKDRIAYNKSREKILNEIKSRSDINDDVKRASEILNTYNYNGNVEYKPTFNPVASMSMAQVAGYVSSLTPERSEGNTKNGANDILLDKDGNITKDFKQARTIAGSVGGGISGSYHEKTADELRGMFYNVITTDSKINSALKQQYDVAKVLWNEANRIANDESLTEAEREKAREDIAKYGMELEDKDGFIPSYNEWLKRKAVPMIESMAYRNTTTTDNRSSNYSKELTEWNAAQGIVDLSKIEDDNAVESTPVEIDPGDVVTMARQAFKAIVAGTNQDASSDAQLVIKKPKKD